MLKLFSRHFRFSIQKPALVNGCFILDTKRVISAVFVLCTVTQVTKAHGFAIYISTPVSPAKELHWWFFFAMAILLLGTFLIFWRIIGQTIPWAIGLSICSILLFTISFFMFGRFAASRHTGPPPGLGFPHHTFWGMRWNDVGILFVQWNIYGCIFFLLSLYFCGCFHRKKRHFAKAIPFAIFIYLATLSPYIVAGSWVHGWAGGYIHSGCRKRLNILNDALLAYAEKHDEKLPEANSLDSLLEKLDPFISSNYLFDSVPLCICPVEDAYRLSPRPYQWNSHFSGKKLEDIDLDNLHEEAPLTCLYHGTGWIYPEFVMHILDLKHR
jgi:hypothetical protein